METQEIPGHSILLNLLKEQRICFSYFQMDQNDYLFVSNQTSMKIDFLYHYPIQKWNSKKRKIRSALCF